MRGLSLIGATAMLVAASSPAVRCRDADGRFKLNCFPRGTVVKMRAPRRIEAPAPADPRRPGPRKKAAGGR